MANNKRVVTIVINASGKEIRETTADIEKLDSGLRDLDLRQAKEAQETLKALGYTDLKNAVQQLKDIKQAASGIDDKSIHQFTNVLQSEMDTAATAGESYLTVLRRFKPELDQLANNLKSGAVSQEDYNRRIASLPPIMQRAISDSRQFGNEIHGVGEQVERASSQFDKLKNAGATVQNFGNSIKGIGQTLTVGVTLPIIGLGVAIAKTGMEYETALNGFQAVTRATSEEMAQAAEVAKQLGADVSLPATSAKDAAIAMEELAKAGLTATQSMGAAKGVLQLSAAAQIEVARAAVITGDALNAFGLKAVEANRVSDLLAGAASSASGSVTDMAEALQQSAAGFAAAKIPIEDLTTVIAEMAKNGIKGSDAGTSLKTFLSSIQAPSEAGAKTLSQLGISVFDLQGKMKPLPDIIGQFEKSLASLTDEQKVQAIQKIFGSDASRAAQILFSEGTAGFAKMKEAVTQTGAAADLANAKTKGLGGSWERLKSQAETLGITIYDQLKDRAAGAVDYLGEKLGKVSDYISGLAKTNPEIIQIAAGFLMVAAVVAPLLIIFGTLAIAIGGVVTAIGTIAGAVSAAGGLAVIAPIIVGIVAVVGLLIGIALAVYTAWQTNFGGIRDFTQIVGEGIKTAWGEALTAVSDLTDKVLAEVKQFWEQNGDDIEKAVQKVSDFIKKTWQGVVDFWTENGDKISAITQSAWGIVSAIVIGAVKTIGGIIKFFAAVINGDWGKVWDSLIGIGKAGGDVLVALIKGVGALALAATKFAFNSIWALGGFILDEATKLGKYVIQGLVNGITSGAGAVKSAISSVANGVLNTIRGVFRTQSPSKVTTEIGEFLSEGLANGITNKAPQARAAAKKLADATIKELNEAVKKFNQISGMSPEQVQRKAQADDYQKGVSELGEIVKMRGQTGINIDNELPQTLAGVSAEYNYLKDKIKAAEDAQKSFDKSLEDMRKGADATREDIRKYEESFEKLKATLSQDGTNESLRLQQEIELLGVTDEVEKERIKNAYELIALRQKLKTDGFGEQQIEEAIKIKKATQGNSLDLVREKVGKQTGIESAKKQADEAKKQADEAQKHFDEISKRIEESFGRITEAFKGGFKKGFSAIWGELKSAFATITQSFAQSLQKRITDAIMGGFGGAGSGGGSSSSGGFGGIIKNLIGSLFGGGNRSTSAGGGSNSGSDLSALFGGGASSSSASGAGGGMWGGWNQLSSDRNALGNQLGGGKINIANLFGKGGIFGSKGFGFNSGTIGVAGMGAGILGSLIGGTGGNVLSGAASGIGAASALSSILGVSSIGGPVGLAIGAAIGGGIALFSALFGKSKQRKADEKARTQFMRDAVANMGELDRLIADVKGLGVDPASAIATGEGIGRQIRDNYMQQANALKDKKTRNIALRDVGQIDSAIAAKMVVLRGAVDVSSAAKDNRERIIPQFATGAYIDPAFLKQYGEFKRRNGMLQGAFTGQDTLPAMLAKGEMVLNPRQINAVITAAGGVDLFKYAKIPGYASGTYVAPSPSAPSPSIVAPSPYSNPNNQSSERRKIEITIINNNKGFVESDMPQIIVKGLDDYDVTTKLFDKINDGRRRNKVG